VAPLLAALLAAVAAAAPDDGAVTVLGTGPLRESRAVVRAEVERVAASPSGVEIATVLVKETLWGEAAESPRLRLLTHEPGYFGRLSPEAVFFVDPVGASDRYAVRAVVELEGEAGKARLAALRRCLEVERLPAGDRAAALRAVIFEGLGATDAWTRQNAARELVHLAGLRPGTFSPEDARDVRKAASRARDRVLRPLLVEASEILVRASAAGTLAPSDPGAVTLRGAPLLKTLREDPDPRLRRAAAEAAAGEGAAGEAALRAALAGDADAGVRAAAAEALGRSAGRDAADDLLRAAKGDGDLAVRAAAVEALGAARAEAAAGVLRDLARKPPASLAREALFALARIRTEEALAAIRGVRAEAAAEDGDAARETRDLADFLLSEDFLLQEKALRRLRSGD